MSLLARVTVLMPISSEMLGQDLVALVELVGDVGAARACP